MHDFDRLYRENAEIVCRYLFSLSRDADLAEELTQQTFCEAIHSADKYRGDAAMSTYLCGIAKNLLKKEWLRRSKQPQFSIEEVENTTAQDTAEADALASASKGQLFKRIHLLPEKMREVVYLRLTGELSFREIGEIVGESEIWARVMFYRAKQNLKDGGDT